MEMESCKRLGWSFAALVAAVVVAGCSGSQSKKTKVSIDGSSTVYPISQAVAEEFQNTHPGVYVTVGISGTGGGFKKFLAGETDINDASRPIKQKELQQAQAKGIQFLELPVAYDGLTVVVNPKNDFVDHLTVEELKKIWEPGSKVRTWKDVRPQWPDREIKLYGPGTDSGTFDYFTEAVVGKAGQSRSDYQASEDDNVLVTGVSSDEYALGYFGFSYYVENKDKLKAVPIDGGNGPVAPSLETVKSGRYVPLSRPLLIYVSVPSLRRSEVAQFVQFYLDECPVLSKEVGYIPLSDAIYDLVRQRFQQRIPGTMFQGVEGAVDLEKLLRESMKK